MFDGETCLADESLVGLRVKMAEEHFHAQPTSSPIARFIGAREPELFPSQVIIIRFGGIGRDSSVRMTGGIVPRGKAL
jgi:hypothetical protein